MGLRLAWIALLAASSAAGATHDYTTRFLGTEAPLAEGGAWTHLGLDWATVAKSDGLAFGTQDGHGGYDDSYAYLSGFAPDQSATATIHTTAGMKGYHEVELLLRWSDGLHRAQGYECTLSYAGHAYIVRWNGPFGDFTTLTELVAPAPREGDVMHATIAGNVITLYLNDRQVAKATDNTYRTGNPGIGFFRSADNSNRDFGFTGFSAHSADDSQTPASGGGGAVDGFSLLGLGLLGWRRPGGLRRARTTTYRGKSTPLTQPSVETG